MYRVYICENCKAPHYTETKPVDCALGSRLANNNVMIGIPSECKQCGGTIFTMKYANDTTYQPPLEVVNG